MDFCTKCGTPLANQAVCPNCGERTTKTAVTSSTSVTDKLEPQVPRNIGFLGAVCYVAGWVSGLVMLSVYHTMPHDDPRRFFLLFHAAQSVIVFGGLTIVYVVLFEFHIPIILVALLALGIAFWLLLMSKAYQGYKYKLPIAGDYAESFAQRQ
jgi:uncharacterized membrane protein